MIQGLLQGTEVVLSMNPKLPVLPKEVEALAKETC
jgi:hypothetical protein